MHVFVYVVGVRRKRGWETGRASDRDRARTERSPSNYFKNVGSKYTEKIFPVIVRNRK